MNAKNVLIAGAAAVLLLTGAVVARAGESAGANQVGCLGVNSCKGHSACASAHNSCKRHNSCKGMGVVLTNAQECKDKGDTVTDVPHPAS